ncbi:MAG: nucleotidyltransferase family protein, partial [Pseudomonadales bacterium]
RAARLPTGETLLEATLSVLCPAAPLPLLVLRPGETAPAPFQDQVRVVPSPRWDEGQGHSLAAGAAAWDPAAAPWLLIALGDMPYLQRETLRALEHACEEAQAAPGPTPLIAPSFRGQRGHPVAVPARLRTAALALRGDQGLKALFASEPVRLLPVHDPGVCRDVDRPEDLAGDLEG